MRKILSTFAITVLAVTLLSSCLNSADEDSLSYDDTAITSFSVGKLNLYLHTTSSTGADSVYQKTVEGKNQRFYIDQIAGVIYNPDSLPYGTDAAHVLVFIGTKNGGGIALKSLTSDSLSYFSDKDSIDFTSPRVFRVFSYSQQAQRDYTVHVNVHKEIGSAFNWKKVGESTAFAQFQGMKAVACNGKMYLFGRNGSHTEIYGSEYGTDWTGTNTLMEADAYKSVVVKGDALFVFDNGNVRKMDGSSWTDISSPQNVKQLVGSSEKALYAVWKNREVLMSADDGITWTEETVADNAAMLPVQDFSLVAMPLKTNPELSRLTLLGNRNAGATSQDSTATVWFKIEEGSTAGEWSHIPFADGNRYPMPYLKGTTAVAYGDDILAMGGGGQGTDASASFSTAYTSKDGGITWKPAPTYNVPKELSSNGIFALMKDKNNYLWLICGGTGQIWRGRLNSLGWAAEQKTFTE